MNGHKVFCKQKIRRRQGVGHGGAHVLRPGFEGHHHCLGVARRVGAGPLPGDAVDQPDAEPALDKKGRGISRVPDRSI